MASLFLKDKILSVDNVNITVNGLSIHSYGFDEHNNLILRAVQTLDWEKEKHFYFEWTISEEQWANATVEGNKITATFGESKIDIEVWAEIKVDLEEFQQ